MSILLLSEIFPPKHGGSGRWFFELYRRLPEGVVTILTHQNHNDQEAAIDAEFPQTIVRVPMASTSWGLKSLTGLRFYSRMIKTALQHKPKNLTQIHCGRTLHEGFIGLLVATLLRKPLVCYVHGEDVEVARTSRELALIVKAVLKGSTRLICNSLNTQSLLVEHWQIPIEKIDVLNPGVDEQTFTPAHEDQLFKKRNGWTGKTVCLTVGRLQKRKGHDRMIEALPAVLTQYPNFLYVIVGNGDELTRLKQLAIEHNVEAHVQFKSEINDHELVQCYQQCDLFILPNRTEGNDIEGFGMVLVEAQAAGKPVIAGDSGGTKETMLVGTTGLIADCTQPEKIADAVHQLLSQQSDTQFDAQTCREHVLKNFTWKEHTVKALAVFNRVSNGTL